MNVDIRRKTVSVAPVNLKPEEEMAIRAAFDAARPEGENRFTYALMGNESLRDAEILIANLETSDFDRTNKLLKRVYGVKTTVFLSESGEPQKQTEYKYVVPRNRLNDTLMQVLDNASRNECGLRLEKPAAPRQQPQIKIDIPADEVESRQGNYVGRALIVDDSPSVRTQMKMFLGKNRFECYIAENSEEALRAVKQIDFDIIFLDVIMPGADGYQACKAIKSLLGPRVPVILLTSKNSPVDKIHGIMSGCDKYLTKPVRSSELYNLLKSYFPKFKQASAVSG